MSFSFGRNWQDFLATVTDATIAAAARDLDEWLGRRCVEGKRVLHIGSGSA